MFPALSEEQTRELNEQERIDVDSEGMDSIDQAATTLITGSNFTNGLPIDACLKLAAAVPIGKCHNGDEDLKYYHSEVFPAYNDKDGFLAHQITGVMALITCLTGCTLAKLRETAGRIKAPEVQESTFRIIQTAGAILGNTMGLGKTHTALMAVEYMGRRRFLKDTKGHTEPVILVCPDIGVALQWYEKINSFTTSLGPFLAHGDGTHDPGSRGIPVGNRVPPEYFTKPGTTRGLNTKFDGFWDNTNTNAKSKIPRQEESQRWGTAEVDLFRKLIGVQRELDILTGSTVLHQWSECQRAAGKNSMVEYINAARRDPDMDLPALLAPLLDENASPITTAYDWLYFRVRSSPKLMAILQLVEERFLQPLIDNPLPRPSKILIVEEIPALAFLIELMLEFSLHQDGHDAF
ncbi:hypothetical protein PG996_002999 [Apiospora saccharicola]|uniref:SNF2 N-terminal domain-containing protein n=1 Tax=Apiospora saccharicola TaxID=335842 RepID=A0ABR1W002_9PEZI